MMLTWMVSVASMVRKLVYEREIQIEEVNGFDIACEIQENIWRVVLQEESVMKLCLRLWSPTSVHLSSMILTGDTVLWLPSGFSPRT